jgi:hypothetical protein
MDKTTTKLTSETRNVGMTAVIIDAQQGFGFGFEGLAIRKASGYPFQGNLCVWEWLRNQ